MFNKINETKQRFAIKKYTFGVASALVGVFFFGTANAAQAEETAPASNTAVVAPASATAPVADTTTAAPAVAPAAPVAESIDPAQPTQTGDAKTAAGVVIQDNGTGGPTTARLTKYTLSEGVTAQPPMSEPVGAAVSGVQTPKDLNYQIDPEVTRNTFSIFNFAGLNEDQWKAEPKYGTVSRPYDENDERMYVRIVNKNDHSVWDEMAILPGENKEFTKAIPVPPGNDLPVVKYSKNEVEGVTAYNLQFGRIAGGIQHIMNTVEKNLESPARYTDVNYALAKMVNQSTFYMAVNPKNTTFKIDKADATIQDYAADGSEKLLGTFTQVVVSGQEYKASGVREFEGYELYQTLEPGTETGHVVETLPVGYRYRNAFGQNAKRIVEVVGPNNTTKIQLWYRDPNSTAPDTQANNNDTNLITDGYVLAGETVNLKGDTWNTEPLINRNPTGEILRAVDDQGRTLVFKGELTAGNPTSVAAGAQIGNYFTTRWETEDGQPVGNATFNGKVYGTGHMRLTNSASAIASDNVYYYVQKSRVLVNYIDAETGKPLSGTGLTAADATVGTPIADKETTTSKASVIDTDWKMPSAGDTYDTTDHKHAYIESEDGKLYRLVAKEGTTTDKATTYGADAVVTGATHSPEKGELSHEVKTVTYAYELVKGDVVVNYIREEDRKVISPKVTDTPLTPVDEAYDTTDNKPNRIVDAEDGKTYYLVEAKTEGTEKGKVVEGTTEVTYVYKEKKEGNNVVVNYINEKGEVIKDPVTDTKDSSTGVDYNTEADNKPNKITAPDGKTYVIVPNKTIGDETGKVKEGVTEVTYVYKEVFGDVVVNYVDEQGNVLKDKVTDTPTSSTGVEYDTAVDNKPNTIEKDGKTYVLVPELTKGTEKGKVVEGTTEITYVYTLSGDVVVNYINTNGEVIKEKVTDTPASKTGTDYDTAADNKPEEIVTADGKTYKLLPALTIGTEKGKVVEGTTEITYVYEEVKGEVVVNYVDEAGNVIANPVRDTKLTSTGVDYDTTDNKPTLINENGKVYELIPTATIGTEKGKVVKGITEITYVYREVKEGNVVVNYVDEQGNVLQTPVTDTFKAQPGVEYDTTDYKPTVIVTKDGKTYVLVPTKTVGTEKGKVVAGTTEITYVYKEAKDVTTKYVDENGNVLVPGKDGAKDRENVPGYEIVDTKVDENGNITYVYRPNPTATTKYVDENGNVLVPGKDGAKPGENVPGYEIVDTKVDEKGNVTHVYRPNPNATTKHVDENGNVLAPGEKGAKGNQNIPGYEIVDTKVDEKGNVTHVYRPNPNTTTKHVDENGNELAVGEKGAKGNQNIPGYEIVDTKVDEKGNVTHVYRPNPSATTKYVDVNGNVLAPGKDGAHPYANVPGYVLVDTIVDEKGNVTHIYKPTTQAPTTIYVDENGNVLAPGKDGKHPFANIPGYVLVETKVDENGNTIHVYRKVSQAPTTIYVDENGNVLAPGKDGKHPFANIPGYVLVETKVDENGNTIHVYRKVTEAKPAAKKEVKAGVLPKTSATTESNPALPAGLAAALAAAGLLSTRRRNEK